ncbi:hypothetical protein ACFW5U_27740 [Streptomyces rochei]|uniref:hypothetical protein n=1 Tax=Streptomyces rochei TaxID=1928 RepID=UPI0036BA15E2
MSAVPESAARLSPEREAEIAARAEAATPGPWGTYRDLDAVYTIQARPRTTRDGMENDGDIATLAVGRSDAEGYANARFAAHAREDVPTLLAELAAVRAERDQAREAALREAADHFVRMADREPDPHGYRARVMRGAANDIRRLIQEPAR